MLDVSVPIEKVLLFSQTTQLLHSAFAMSTGTVTLGTTDSMHSHNIMMIILHTPEISFVVKVALHLHLRHSCNASLDSLWYLSLLCSCEISNSLNTRFRMRHLISHCTLPHKSSNYSLLYISQVVCLNVHESPLSWEQVLSIDNVWIVWLFIYFVNRYGLSLDSPSLPCETPVQLTSSGYHHSVKVDVVSVIGVLVVITWWLSLS